MRENNKTVIVGGSPEFFIFPLGSGLPLLRLTIGLFVGLVLIGSIVRLVSPSPSTVQLTVNGKPVIGAQAHYGRLFPKLEQPLTELEDGVFRVDKFEYEGKARLVIRYSGLVRICSVSPRERIAYDRTGNENGAGYISTTTKTRYYFGVFPVKEITAATLFSNEKSQQYREAGLTQQQI